MLSKAIEWNHINCSTQTREERKEGNSQKTNMADSLFMPMIVCKMV